MWSYLGVALIFCSGFSSSFGHALIGKWRVLAMASLHWLLKTKADGYSPVVVSVRRPSNVEVQQPLGYLTRGCFYLVGPCSVPCEIWWENYSWQHLKKSLLLIIIRWIPDLTPRLSRENRFVSSSADFDCSTLKAEKLLKNLFFAWCFNSAARMVMD